LGLGVAISAWRVLHDFDLRWSWKPLGRIALASAAAGGVALVVPAPRGWLLPVGAAALCVYAVVLLALGEIRKQDFFPMLGAGDPGMAEMP
jgi:hypothetical protein